MALERERCFYGVAKANNTITTLTLTHSFKHRSIQFVILFLYIAVLAEHSLALSADMHEAHRKRHTELMEC